MEIRKREIFRYLGYRDAQPDIQIMKMVDEVIEELDKMITPKSVTRIFDCKEENGEIFISDHVTEIVIKSNDLSKNLRDCPQVILMAATLGNGPDQLARRYGVTNMAKAAVVQSAAAEFIESYCNMLQEQIKEEQKKYGKFLRPRFSPGYGDLSISYQKQIFEVLSVEKRIGVTLQETLLMLPTKSVTAFIGITSDKENCSINKCRECAKKDCEFRNEN